jgi:Type II secretion system (T2SS), protein G
MRIVSFVALMSFVSSFACGSTPPPPGARADESAGADSSAKIAAARAQLDEITSAWSSFSFSFGRCPQGIDDLVHPPGGEPLLASSPVDPWGHSYAFMPGADGAASQLVSAGPDGELLTDDDLRARANCSEP